MFFVDCTGRYGCGSHEKPEFPTLASHLAELDRLGIAMGITACTVARDTNDGIGNRQLLADIEATPGAKDRIIPAFALAPKDVYIQEDMAFLEECLKSGRVGALVLYPVTGKFALRHMERAFDRLAKYSPLVLMEVNELNGESDYRTLVELAQKYTGMKFLLTNAMWPSYGDLFDAMWRCPNIYTECSRMHVQDTFATIRNYFGEGRVVFGKGYRALCGASVGAITYAQIPEEEKKAVAGETLLSLLPNQTEIARMRAGAKAGDSCIPNSLWQEFLKGGGIRSMPVYDCHAHTGSSTSNGWFAEKSSFKALMDGLTADARRLGIVRQFSSDFDALMGDPLANNRRIERDSVPYRDINSGYYVYNGLYADRLTEAELEARFAGGYFAGIKTLADYWQLPLTDPSYTTAWAYANRHHLPVLCHSWEGYYDTPNRIAQVAEQYPDAVFLIGHAGGGDAGRLQAEAVAKRLPNVYLEYCGSFVAHRTWRETIDAVGADRILFGTDAIGHDQAWELAKLLSENVTDAELELILHKNMEGILARRI